MLIKNIDRTHIDFTADNIRPVSSIGDERVHTLAANIKDNAGRGVLGSGLERAVRVYLDVDGKYKVLDGQERVEALDILGVTSIPCEIVLAPVDIWASTRAQITLHDIDPFPIFALVERAVRLHHTPTIHSTETTWADVCAVMGNDKKYWSHHQHILKLVPELRADVLAGRIRNDAAAYIGRDLSADLQVQHRDLLLANCKKLDKLRQIIDQINDLSTVIVVDTEDEPDEDFSFDDIPDELSSEEPASSDSARVDYLLKQIEKYARKLAKLDTDGFEDRIERIVSLL